MRKIFKQSKNLSKFITKNFSFLVFSFFFGFYPSSRAHLKSGAEEELRKVLDLCYTSTTLLSTTHFLLSIIFLYVFSMANQSAFQAINFFSDLLFAIIVKPSLIVIFWLSFCFSANVMPYLQVLWQKFFRFIGSSGLFTFVVGRVRRPCLFIYFCWSNVLTHLSKVLPMFWHMGRH